MSCNFMSCVDYRWVDAEPEKMISINTKATEMFNGQVINFYCQASPYYFAEGIKWSTLWTNRSRLVSDGQNKVNFLHKLRWIIRNFKFDWSQFNLLCHVLMTLYWWLIPNAQVMKKIPCYCRPFLCGPDILYSVQSLISIWQE